MNKKAKNFSILLGVFLISLSFYISKEETIACSICFTPGQNCTQLIINEINKSKKSILVQSYSFTSLPIANALIAASRRGIKIICIFDKSQINKALIIDLANYFPVFIDKPNGIAHNKVMIIDEKVVLTGSFNFTQAAQHRNVENSIKITSKKIAKQYKTQWDKRKNISKPLAIKEN